MGFNQIKDYFYWKDEITESTAEPTSATLLTVQTPPSVDVIGMFKLHAVSEYSIAKIYKIWAIDCDEPSTADAQVVSASSQYLQNIDTSKSIKVINSQIYHKVNVANGSNRLVNIGYQDFRGAL